MTQGHARPGHASNAVHGVREPAVVELQGPGQVRMAAAVSPVPLGGQGRQFPDGVDMTGPAVSELVATVVLAEHGVGPETQVNRA
jgi:hypothetical protein